MFSAASVKKLLLSDISQMAHSRSSFVNNPKSDFTRDRILTFETVIHFLLSMEAGNTRHELLKYFNYSPDTVTNSALYQQRAKLSANTLPTLFRLFSGHFSPTLYLSKYRLLACDGSDFTYTRNPNDTDCFCVPNNTTSKGYNQVHVNALFDILSLTYSDSVIQPFNKKNEFLALSQMIDSYNYDDHHIPVFIADRGYQSYNVFAHAIENNAFFLIRAKDLNFKRLLGIQMPDETIFDMWITRILTRSNSKRKRQSPDHEADYRFICAAVPFDYIDSQNPEYHINLRVLRFPIGEDSYENIVTNLPNDEFPLETIKYLYSLRWGIESSFCKLKHSLGAINLHSKLYKYVSQELWARLILFNFCSIITSNIVVSYSSKRKHIYQINYDTAYKACHHFLRLQPWDSPPNIEGLISKNLLPIRPGRNYARQRRFRIPVSFVYRF